MTKITTSFNRRSFLKLSAVAGGGVMLGFSWLAHSQSSADVKKLPEEHFNINAYIKICRDNTVTIMSPNPEIGQNVKTSMPMIVAEELDVDWQQVIVEQAGLDTGNYRRQLAGGSQSIRFGWNSLRMAGATVRHILLQAAALKWQVPMSELTTALGVISHSLSSRTITYGEIASDAVNLPLPETVDLKSTDNFHIIGHNTKNVDGKNIVTGKPLYGLDQQFDNQLIAMVVHPPKFGMTLDSVDASVVSQMPGIRHVITIDSEPAGFTKQWSDVNAFPRLVAIVGDSTWQVMKAKKALRVTWKTLSPPESSELHQTLMAESLMSEKLNDLRRDGQPEAAFASAENIIERTYSAPFLAHNTLEPMNFFAHVTKDKAELSGPIQTPEFLRKSLVSLLKLPEEKISIMMTRMGGGFGRRLYGHFAIEAALISQQVKAPIKLIYNREDDMSQGCYRPSYLTKFKAALDNTGALTAFSVQCSGIHGGAIFANRFPAGTVNNYLAQQTAIESNVSTGAWRAPSSNFIAGAEQAFLDEVALVAKQDPIDFRLALLAKGKMSPIGIDNDYDADRYAGVLKLVREKSQWDKPIAGVYRGVSAYYCHNSYVAQVVDVIKVNNGIKISKVWCAVDCGIVVNPEGAINQIEGGIVDGIGHAMYSNITIKDGAAEQENFHHYRMIRHSEAPESIEVFFVDNGIAPTGLGEPSLPPISGALANAIFQATSKRLYQQPFINHI